MGQVTIVLAVLLAVVLAVFGAQNTEMVTLHFLGFTARALPLSLVILGGAVIGALLSFLVGLPGRVRRAVRGGDLTRRSARQESTIAQLQATAAAEASTTASAVPPDRRAHGG